MNTQTNVADESVAIAGNFLPCLPDTFQIELGDIVRTFRGADRFPQVTRERLELHGLSQKIRDSFNTQKGTPAEKMKKADSIWQELLDGKWNFRRSESDPVMVEANRMALDHLMKTEKDFGKLSYGDKKKRIDDLLNDESDKTAKKIFKAAEQIVAIKKSMPDLDLDDESEDA